MQAIRSLRHQPRKFKRKRARDFSIGQGLHGVFDGVRVRSVDPLNAATLEQSFDAGERAGSISTLSLADQLSAAFAAIVALAHHTGNFRC
jgi:hypothetical protein